MSRRVLLDIIHPSPIPFSVGNPTGTIVLIVLVAVLVIAAVVAGIMITRKSKKKNKSS